jgi:hypothetical protein
MEGIARKGSSESILQTNIPSGAKARDDSVG